MKKYYQSWPFNFGAIHNQNFKKSKIAILPVPYEGTASFNGGTRNGPYAIIGNSRYLDELFDSHGDDLVGLKSTDIFTLDELELSAGSPKEAIMGVEQAIGDEILKFNKIPLMLGGEHSITFGAVSALRKKYPDISVLQLDAHADLIDEYVGTKYCVAVNNGTSALMAALEAFKYHSGFEKAKEGSKVITSPLTFIATVNAIKLTNYQPTFVDVNFDDFSMDAEKLKEYLE